MAVFSDPVARGGGVGGCGAGALAVLQADAVEGALGGAAKGERGAEEREGSVGVAGDGADDGWGQRGVAQRGGEGRRGEHHHLVGSGGEGALAGDRLPAAPVLVEQAVGQRRRAQRRNAAQVGVRQREVVLRLRVKQVDPLVIRVRLAGGSDRKLPLAVHLSPNPVRTDRRNHGHRHECHQPHFWPLFQPWCFFTWSAFFSGTANQTSDALVWCLLSNGDSIEEEYYVEAQRRRVGSERRGEVERGGGGAKWTGRQ